jgi:UPF0271 protein
VRPLLNIDAGEHDDEPDALYAVADLVNIACGGHAGDARSMERVLRACKAYATLAGAHPSFEDREGFGRRELAVDARAVGVGVLRQCRALRDVAERVGVEIRYLKPHGALYHAANRRDDLAVALLEGAREGLEGLSPATTIIGPPEGALRRAARALGLRFAREGFADRGMRPDGTLVPRGEPGALLTDPEVARAQARRLITSGAYDTLCVHGDTDGAVAIARAVRSELDAAGRARAERELS